MISAPDNSDKNIYINQMTVNGREYTQNYLLHSEMVNGAVIDIQMADSPNKQRGTSDEDQPYSFTRELFVKK